jgi:hypothetical protein
MSSNFYENISLAVTLRVIISECQVPTLNWCQVKLPNRITCDMIIVLAKFVLRLFFSIFI